MLQMFRDSCRSLNDKSEEFLRDMNESHKLYLYKPKTYSPSPYRSMIDVTAVNGELRYLDEEGL